VRSLAAFRPRQRRVPRVATPILSAHIHDLGFGIFRLGFEGGDQGIFRVHHDVVHLALMLEANGEFHRRIPVAAVEIKAQRWLVAGNPIIATEHTRRPMRRCQNLMGARAPRPRRSRSTTAGTGLQRKLGRMAFALVGCLAKYKLQLG
jgi:hypothetical protein